jgi:hypothetical protein
MPHKTTRPYYLHVEISEANKSVIVRLDRPQLMEFHAQPRTEPNKAEIVFYQKIFGTPEEIAALFPYFNEWFHVTAEEILTIKGLAHKTDIADNPIWCSVGFKELLKKDSKDTLDNLLEYLCLLVEHHYGKFLGI